MSKPIYVIRALYLVQNEARRIVRDRIWGYFYDYETAEQAVLENWTDMYEIGYYNHAVIQEMPEGIMIGRTPETWFKVEYEVEPVPPEYEPKVTKLDYDPLNINREHGKVFLGW